MFRYCLKVSYDGTNYYGFQIQDALPTIEFELMQAFKKLLDIDVKIYAAGRTDRYVHAIGQVCHVDLPIHIPEIGLLKGLNSYLPADIHVKECKKVNEEFHARFSAISKEYRYYINTKEYSPILKNYYPYIPHLDIKAMREGLKYFVGKHDFKAFASAQIDPRKETVKNIYSISLIEGDGYLDFRFLGDGFLKYQVRRMMGIIIEIGRGHYEPNIILDLLESKNPAKIKYIADGCGLYLYQVHYEEE